MAADDTVKLDDIKTEREEGFVPLLDKEKFEAVKLKTIEELRRLYPTEAEQKRRVAELKA